MKRTLVLASAIAVGAAMSVYPQAGANKRNASEQTKPAAPAIGDIPAACLPPEGWKDIKWNDPFPGKWTTIDVSKQGIIPASTNIAPALRALIDGLKQPTILYIPAGAYKMTTLFIDKDNIILKGAGPDKTVITIINALTFTADGRKEWDKKGIEIRGIGGRYTWDKLADDYKPKRITADVAPGQDTLQLENTAGYSVGDYVMVVETLDGWDFDDAKLGRGGFFRIVSMTDKAITLNLPVAAGIADVQNDNRFARVAKITPVKNIGIEDMKLDYSGSTADADTISLKRVVNALLKNLELANARRHHIELDCCSDVVICHNFIHDCHEKGDGGFGYGVLAGDLSTRVLITDNVIKDCRHQVVMQTSANYNVFSYNYIWDSYRDWVMATNPGAVAYWNAQSPDRFSGVLQGDVCLHGNFAHHNLIEGNVGYHFICDPFHKWNGPNNMFFRNCAKGQPMQYKNWYPGVAFWVCGKSDRQNIIGNILLNNSTIVQNSYNSERNPEGTFVAANVIDGAVQWGQMKPDAKLPPSLYLTQKPDFWPQDLAWPPYGPDISGSDHSKIPAQLRYEKLLPLFANK